MRPNSESAFPYPLLVSSVGYDECVERLAYTVDHREDAELEEVVYLISQLAAVIE